MAGPPAPPACAISRHRPPSRPRRRGSPSPFAPAPNGWLLYDGRCPFCQMSMRWLGRPLRRRGIGVMPLQRRWVRQRLNLEGKDLLRAARLLLPDGRVLEGGDLAPALGRRLWFLAPFAPLDRWAWSRRLLRRLYQWVADHRPQLCRVFPCYQRRSAG